MKVYIVGAENKGRMEATECKVFREQSVAETYRECLLRTINMNDGWEIFFRVASTATKQEVQDQLRDIALSLPVTTNKRVFNIVPISDVADVTLPLTNRGGK